MFWTGTCLRIIKIRSLNNLFWSNTTLLCLHILLPKFAIGFCWRFRIPRLARWNRTCTTTTSDGNDLYHLVNFYFYRISTLFSCNEHQIQVKLAWTIRCTSWRTNASFIWIVIRNDTFMVQLYLIHVEAVFSMLPWRHTNGNGLLHGSRTTSMEFVWWIIFRKDVVQCNVMHMGNN